MTSSRRRGLRALLVVVPAALAAVALMPATASAQSSLPQAFVCVGNTENGGFGSQSVSIPAGILQPTVSTCVATPDVEAILGHIKNLQLPGPPELPDGLPEIPLPDPSEPLSVLGTVLALCSPWQDLCNFVLGSALGAPLPLFADLSLNATGGSCDDRSDVTGFASGGPFYSLNGHVDWTKTALGSLGTVSGDASSFFPAPAEKSLTGAILTGGCESGLALGLFAIV